MKLSSSLITLAALAVLACGQVVPEGTAQAGVPPGAAELPPTPPRPPHAPPAEPDGPRAPFLARLEGPAHVQAPGALTVTLTLHSQQPAEQRLRIELELPPGARLRSGRPTEELTLQGQVLRRYELELTALPEADLIAKVRSVTAPGERTGAAATPTYRFGRPEPALAPLPRGPESTLPGGGRLRSVPLPPGAVQPR